MPVNEYGGSQAGEALVALNSVSGGSDYSLDAASLAIILSSPWDGGGIHGGFGDTFSVSPTDPASLAVTVGSGIAFPRLPGGSSVRPAFVRKQPASVAIAAADDTNGRIDVVGILFTLSGLSPNAEVLVVKGTPASTPSKPDISSIYSQNANQWFEELATVSVAANATSIATSDITSTASGLSIRSQGTINIANGYIDSNHIVDSAVTTAKIANSAVTAAKVADNAITTSNIVDGAVTASKLSGSLDSGSITGLKWEKLSISTSSFTDVLFNLDTYTMVLAVAVEGNNLEFGVEIFGQIATATGGEDISDESLWTAGTLNIKWRRSGTTLQVGGNAGTGAVTADVIVMAVNQAS